MLHSCNKYDRNVLLISIRDSEHDNMLCQKVQGWVLGGRRILGYTVIVMGVGTVGTGFVTVTVTSFQHS